MLSAPQSAQPAKPSLEKTTEPPNPQTSPTHTWALASASKPFLLTSPEASPVTFNPNSLKPTCPPNFACPSVRSSKNALASGTLTMLTRPSARITTGSAIVTVRSPSIWIAATPATGAGRDRHAALELQVRRGVQLEADLLEVGRAERVEHDPRGGQRELAAQVVERAVGEADRGRQRRPGRLRREYERGRAAPGLLVRVV